MSSKIYSYLTTPLYYVNAKPHIGHAYTNILTDTFARYYRLRGRKVFFLTGTDEHGTKIQKAAQEQSMTPHQYVDQMVPQFKELWQILGIEYDFFIRTTDESHKKVVQNILNYLQERKDIYKSSYEGWYCLPCESFWTELQLDQGKCPDCKRDVQKLSEENYFFRLSKYQDWLVDYIRSHPEFIQPELRKNEILGFLKEPLEDLCITRPRSRLGWGIDYPQSKDHVVYVWFDALVNYISAVHYGQNEAFEKFWPADIHFVGKDILRHHAVYWPIMLRALGVEMPRTILAHGWWMMAGSKVSKSRGNAVDPIELAKKFGVDGLRYFMLREVSIGQDGAFSEELLEQRYTTDLANDLGNLWSRLGAMLERYFEGKLPALSSSDYAHPLCASAFQLWEEITAAMDKNDPRSALDAIFKVVTLSNQFVEETKPWVLAKNPEKRGDLVKVLGVLAETLAHIASALIPFLPLTAARILERLELHIEVFATPADFARPFLREGLGIQKGEILFPKLEEQEPKES